MSKSIHKETDSSDKRAATLRKKNIPKNKDRFSFGQWESQHREGWDKDDDEYNIHEDSHHRRRY